MRYSGMGYLDESGAFQVHRNILESLSIFDDAILFGIYYPIGKEKQNAEEIFHPDFMFTPIPYDLWPKTARLIIRVRKQAEAIRKISSVLKENYVTILNSVSNRSAHRYSTWDLHIAFEDVIFEGSDVIKFKDGDQQWIELKDETSRTLNGFNEQSNVYSIIVEKLDSLVRKIKAIDSNQDKENETILFQDPKEKVLEESIIPRVNSALHFFYNKAENNKHDRVQKREQAKLARGNADDEKPDQLLDSIGVELYDKMYDFLFSPFSVRYVRGNLIVQDENNSDISRILSNSGGKINNILYLSFKNTKDFYNVSPNSQYEYRDILPTITFVEADSHFLGIRVVVIPKHKVQKFVKLNVYYQRQNNPYSSRGLLEYISSKLPSYYKIWKYHNRLFECRPTYGNGKLTFYLEDERSEANYGMNSFLEELNWTINELNTKIVEEELTHLQDFQLKGKSQNLSTVLAKQFKTNNSVKKENLKDVFISFSSQDKKDAELIQEILRRNGLTSYLSSKELSGGDFFSENIRQALINTREFCLLYSPKSMKNSWVTTEWGAAWALQKRITPILLDMTVDQIVPEHDRLKNLQYIRFRISEIEDYAKLVFQRRFIPF